MRLSIVGNPSLASLALHDATLAYLHVASNPRLVAMSPRDVRGTVVAGKALDTAIAPAPSPPPSPSPPATRVATSHISGLGHVTSDGVLRSRCATTGSGRGYCVLHDVCVLGGGRRLPMAVVAHADTSDVASFSGGCDGCRVNVSAVSHKPALGGGAPTVRGWTALAVPLCCSAAHPFHTAAQVLALSTLQQEGLVPAVLDRVYLPHQASSEWVDNLVSISVNRATGNLSAPARAGLQDIPVHRGAGIGCYEHLVVAADQDPLVTPLQATQLRAAAWARADALLAARTPPVAEQPSDAHHHHHAVVFQRQKGRVIANLPDVVAVVEEFGMSVHVVADAAALAWAEEVAALRRATVVVAATGAALTASLFMRPGTALVEHFPYRNYEGFAYARAARVLGLVYLWTREVAVPATTNWNAATRAFDRRCWEDLTLWDAWVTAFDAKTGQPMDSHAPARGGHHRLDCVRFYRSPPTTVVPLRDLRFVVHMAMEAYTQRRLPLPNGYEFG